MGQGLPVRPAFAVGQLAGSLVELSGHRNRLFRRTTQGGKGGSELIKVLHSKKARTSHAARAWLK